MWSTSSSFLPPAPCEKHNKGAQDAIDLSCKHLKKDKKSVGTTEEAALSYYTANYCCMHLCGKLTIKDKIDHITGLPLSESLDFETTFPASPL
ncbi:hypothetical protein L596_002106 [Steinernema carpocapsae]|uniref:Uncharacterized protein n=1 Tax=Steinernema carpocapsae TaxID=34508 RepID=A0A4U8UN82_STECR|nr:hypothetical protein L596_002106 [Steinernema carpocapsae]